MKKICVLVLLMSVVFSLCSCNSAYVTEPTTNETTTEKEVELMPNELLKQYFDGYTETGKKQLINFQNSMQNDGTFTFDGDWLYGLYYNKFVKCRSDYSDIVTLDDNGICFNIQVNNSRIKQNNITFS